ncbi:ATP-grasp domain-containing protein [Actinophytocola glycyrrhizae]|uniref:Acetyl-CoA carboxylase biotin carboxylase subunit family protein n=1 Tax=Actinophytocola glycyrrhizae TaxID=2044873 RepID=A0ABV9RUB3_9PSEU
MLIVPFTEGAASPVQVAAACGGQVDFVFLVDEQDGRIAPAVPMLHELAPVVTHDGDLPQVLEQLAPFEPHGVVTFSDSTMQLAAAIAKACGIPYNSQETCVLLRSKLKQRQCLNDAGVGSVRTFGFSLDQAESVSLPADVPFPAVVKPEVGAASKNAVFVASRDELTARLAELTPGVTYVLEEYLHGAELYEVDWLGDYLSVESVVSGGAIRHFGMSARLPLVAPFREGGLVFPVRPDDTTAVAITDLAERAIKTIGITIGLVHTEIKMTPDGPRIIEVNGRLGGALERLVPRATGIDPVRLAVDIALGAPLPGEFGAPSQLAMVVWVQPPMSATAVAELPSIRELRELPGVFGVDRLRKNEHALDWRNGSLGRVFDIWLDAGSLTELGERYSAVVDVLDNGIKWKLESAGGRRNKED